MTTSEKVAYLKGLADGLGLGKETKEEKLISAIIDVLDTIAVDMEDLEETCLDLGEEIDAISDDLSDVEDFLYEECCGDECCCGGDDEGECCCGDGDHEGGCCCGDEAHEDGCCQGEGHKHEDEGGCCGGHGHHDHHGHSGGCGCGGHGHHAVLYEVTCPGCNNTITIDEEVLNLGSIQCPSCGGVLEFDLEATKDEKPEEVQE